MTDRLKVALALTVLTSCAEQVPPPVPLFEARVDGEQIYACEGVDPNQWTYKATEGTLLDSQSRRVGIHRFDAAYRIPATWSFNDGSRVTGEIIGRDKAADAKSVPELTFAVRWHQGAGALAKVEDIHQVSTKGGLPPSSGCTQMGSELRVPFSAVHRFYETGKLQ